MRSLPVRVKVRIRAGKVEAATSALLNTGFTAEENDILIPKTLAERLNLWPPPPNSIAESVETAGGETIVYRAPEPIDLQVEATGRQTKPIRCRAIVSTHVNEVLLSDSTIEALQIQILSPKKGGWRFRGEEAVRPSVEPEEWG